LSHFHDALNHFCNYTDRPNCTSRYSSPLGLSLAHLSYQLQFGIQFRGSFGVFLVSLDPTESCIGMTLGSCPSRAPCASHLTAHL